MRLGISTFAYTWSIGVPGLESSSPMSGLDFLASANSFGVHLVQIADNLPLHVLSTEQLQALRGYAGSHAIEIEVGTRGLTDDNIAQYLEIADFFDSPILRIITDATGFYPDPDEITVSLRKWAVEAKRRDIILAVENHDRFSSRTLADIMERVDSSHVGICLDTVNSFGALEGPETVVANLAPYTVNVHLKDFRIFRPFHNMGFTVEGTPAGEGMLDICLLLGNPHIKRRNPHAILELWTPPSPKGVDATVETEREWVSRSLKNLDTLFVL